MTSTVDSWKAERASLDAAWRATDIPTGTLPNGWTVDRYTIDDNHVGNLLETVKHGRGTKPGDYTRLFTDHGELMMSDTDAERNDHHQPIFAASVNGGHMVIGGLGLGCVLRSVLTYSKVARVTVIETEQALIDWVAPTIDDPRVDYRQGDVFKWKWEKGSRFEYVWMDIWPNLCTDNLDEMATLRRRFARVSMTTECWGRELLLHYRRQERQRGW